MVCIEDGGPLFLRGKLRRANTNGFLSYDLSQGCERELRLRSMLACGCFHAARATIYAARALDDGLFLPCAYTRPR